MRVERPEDKRVSQAFRPGAQSVPVLMLARPPAHLPEIGLEPGRFLEDRGQLGFAPRRGITSGKAVEVRPRLRRDLLVWRAGILVDPDLIGVRCGARIGPRRE